MATDDKKPVEIRLLDTFTRAYITCALWSSTDNSRDDGGDPLDKNHEISDLDESALVKMSADCDRFRAMTGPDGRTMDELIPDDDQGGHDFWLTRNRHGAGFWDRERIYGVDESKVLTVMAHSMGECDMVLGDDGAIYCEGGK